MEYLCKILCCCFYSKKNKKENLLEEEELEEINENEIFLHKYYREDEKKIKLNLTKEKILGILEIEFGKKSDSEYKEI